MHQAAREIQWSTVDLKCLLDVESSHFFLVGSGWVIEQFIKENTQSIYTFTMGIPQALQNMAEAFKENLYYRISNLEQTCSIGQK